MRVNVNIIENIKIPIWFNQIEKFVKQVLKKLKKYRGEISVVFCDDEYMKTVNKQYRNIDESTDILSFESQMEAKFFLQKIYEAIYGKYRELKVVVVLLFQKLQNILHLFLTYSN